MTDEGFGGFPGLAKSTAIPNIYFSALLPDVQDPSELLAFLWVQRALQAQTGGVRFTTEGDLWAVEALRRSFRNLGGGRPGLRRGLEASVRRGTLLSLSLSSPDGGQDPVYFVNNPGSRRAVVRARAGDLALKPGTVVVEPPHPARPGIFSLYEEYVGTITPFVGERLMAAEERFPPSHIEAAFREAAELNVRNWRYIERVLDNWEREGRGDGANRGDSLEERKRRFLGAERSRPRS